jgi:hypothetical protein
MSKPEVKRAKRDKRDLSASWEEETGKPLAASVSSSSSGDDESMIQYRALLRSTKLACKKSTAYNDADDGEIDPDDDDEENDLTSMNNDMDNVDDDYDDSAADEKRLERQKKEMQREADAAFGVYNKKCQWGQCSANFECHRCGDARRKKRQQQSQRITEEELTLQSRRQQSQLPPLALRKTNHNAQSAIDRLKTLQQQRQSQTMPGSVPMQQNRPPVKYYDTLKTSTPSPSSPQKRTVPPMQTYGKPSTSSPKSAPKKTYNENSSTLDSKATFTERALPGLKAKPLNLNGAYANRLNSVYTQASKAQSPELAKMLVTGFKSMDCHMGGESTQNVLGHLRESHAKFYDLLEVSGVLKEMKNMRSKDKKLCFIFAVPPGQLLTEQRPDDDTLRGHVIKTSEGISLKKIRERTIMPTLLAGKDVQLEYRADHIYVDGYMGEPDSCYPGHVILIDAVLGPINLPTSLPPPLDAPMEEQEEKDEDDSSVEEVEIDQAVKDENTANSSNTTDDSDTTQEMLMTRQSVTLATQKVLMNPSLNTLATKMSLKTYQTMNDLASDCECKPMALSSCNAKITLRSYDTHGLYQQWQAHSLPDLVRVAPTRLAVWNAPSTIKIRTPDGTSLHEYTVSGTDKPLTLQEVSRGLLEIGVSSVSQPNTVTRLLCKVIPQQQQQQSNDTAVYITANEQVMLRFKAGVLSQISVNQAHTMPIDRIEHKTKSHFLEVHLSETERTRLSEAHSKHEFDSALLMAGTLSKYTKKAKKYVKKKARNVMSGAQAQSKKQLSLKLQPASHPEILTDLWAAPQGDGQANKAMAIKVYDRKMRERDAESQSGLLATRYVASNGSVFYVVDSDNQLYDVLQRTDNYYADITLDQWKITLNASLITGRSQVYYADGANSDVYVLGFEDHALKQVGKISRNSAQYKSMK